jgi:hypothetical protein
MLVVLVGAIITVTVLLSVLLSLYSSPVVDYRVYSVAKKPVAAAKHDLDRTVVSRDRRCSLTKNPAVEGSNRGSAVVTPAPAPAPEVVPEVVPEVPAETTGSEVQHINDVTTPKFAEFGDKGAA